MPFPHRLKAAREAQNLSQAEFAKRLGVSQTAVSNWEAGKMQPRQKLVEKMAGLLRVTPEHLRKGTSLTQVQPKNPGATTVPSPLPAPVPLKTAAEVVATAKVELAGVLGVPVEDIELKYTVVG